MQKVTYEELLQMLATQMEGRHTMDDGDINDRWENFPSHDILK